MTPAPALSREPVPRAAASRAPGVARRPVATFAPALSLLRKAIGRPPSDVLTQATERWEIAPASPVESRPGKALPGQLERIRGTEFGTLAEVVRDLSGGFEAMQSPTIGYRLENVVLVGGVLYCGTAVRHLRAGSQHKPVGLVPREAIRASMYESWVGNRWFGNWLSEDCLTYALAEATGAPLTSGTMAGHQADYERRLGMSPVRTAAARFAELMLFDDSAHNEHKRERANALRRRLVPGSVRRHPGVFILRGQSGERRVLLNERAVAEHLAARRGFHILDPTRTSVAEIVRVCSGAEVIAGTEGSHLVHGLMVMPPDARAFVVQPPARAVSVLKLITDRQGQDYSFVVGVGTNEAFRVDAGEVERTLDLR